MEDTNILLVDDDRDTCASMIRQRPWKGFSAFVFATLHSLLARSAGMYGMRPFLGLKEHVGILSGDFIR